MTEATQVATPHTPHSGGFAAGYALALLFLANVLNLADGVLLGIVVEPVRQELNLTDTQMSLVTGFAFIAFNLLMGIFIARWVDRGKRVWILAGGVALWSLATAGTAYANSFESLALTRVMVGIGGATVFPVAMSMLADYYSPARLPHSVSIFQASAGIGVIGGSILAGVLASAYGWRMMFTVCGLAGLVAVVLIVFTLRDPERGRQDGVKPGSRLLAPEGLGKSLSIILTRPGFVWLALGYGASHMVFAVLPTWMPTFLLRSHGVDMQSVGALIGPPAGLGGIAGTILFGMLATFLIKRHGSDRAGLLAPIFAMPIAAFSFAGMMFSPTLPGFIISVAITNFMLSSSLGACIAIALRMSPPTMRGLTSTLMLMVQGLLGLAIAPLIVGIVSDALAPSLGEESLRYGLAAMIVVPLFAAVFVAMAYRRMGRSEMSGS